MEEAARIISFWRAAGPERWFKRDDAFDAEITARFAGLHARAASGGLAAWEENAQGALALLLLLDQFSRNMFRASARAFATDTQARAVADRALARKFDAAAEPELRQFFYLPFMHSENIADQDRCVALYEAAHDADGVGYARTHRDIIARFGRFPHRNRALSRQTTPEEQAFLDEGGFAG